MKLTLRLKSLIESGLRGPYLLEEKKQPTYIKNTYYVPNVKAK